MDMFRKHKEKERVLEALKDRLGFDDSDEYTMWVNKGPIKLKVRLIDIEASFNCQLLFEYGEEVRSKTVGLDPAFTTEDKIDAIERGAKMKMEKIEDSIQHQIDLVEQAESAFNYFNERLGPHNQLLIRRSKKKHKLNLELKQISSEQVIAITDILTNKTDNE